MPLDTSRAVDVGSGKRPQEWHVLRAVALHNCCACFEFLGQYSHALQVAKRALRAASAVLPPTDPLLARLQAVEAAVASQEREQLLRAGKPTERRLPLGHSLTLAGSHADPASQTARQARLAAEAAAAAPPPKPKRSKEERKAALEGLLRPTKAAQLAAEEAHRKAEAEKARALRLAREKLYVRRTQPPLCDPSPSPPPPLPSLPPLILRSPALCLAGRGRRERARCRARGQGEGQVRASLRHADQGGNEPRRGEEEARPERRRAAQGQQWQEPVQDAAAEPRGTGLRAPDRVPTEGGQEGPLRDDSAAERGAFGGRFGPLWLGSG